MDWIPKAIEFLGTYPVWAKLVLLGCLAAAIATLLLAPRMTVQVDDEASGPYLDIAGVSIFPPGEGVLVQVDAYVNGINYHYPAVGGVEWMEVGPTMSGHRFTLPKSQEYNLRFELRVNKPNNVVISSSQEILSIRNEKLTGDYNLHAVTGNVRAAPVNAAIRFTLNGSTGA